MMKLEAQVIFVNELFKEGVAGRDLKLSPLLLFNRMREGKGQKIGLQNYRGIFIVTVFRSILMRLIYLEKYEILYLGMSDSQVGF